LDRVPGALAEYRDRRLSAFLSPISAGPPLTDPRAEFGAIPLLEKWQLQQKSREYIASGADPEAHFRVQTTGSTGVPLELWFDRRYFVSFYAYFLYFMHRLKRRPPPFSVSLMSLSVSPKASYDLDNYWFIQPALNFSIFQRVNLRSAEWGSPAGVVQSIAAKEPMTIRAFPSTLELLADYVEKHPSSVPIRPTAVISDGETLLPAVRGRLENLFQTTVVDEYGLSEVGGAVALECRERSGFHVNVQDYYVEVVDPSGKPVADGTEGEVVITNLYHSLVPIVRYRTGDYGSMSSEPCGCGALSPRLRKLTGRPLSRFKLPNGDSYSPFEMYREYLLSLPVTRFQMVQEELRKFTLYFIGDPAVSECALIHGLRAKVRLLHSDAAVLRVKRMTDLPSGRKFQVFVSLADSMRQ
jgi:phenylacetate-CoA ligase